MFPGGAVQYQVRIVEDGALAGKRWMLIRHEQGVMVAVERSAFGPNVALEWLDAYHRLIFAAA